MTPDLLSFFSGVFNTWPGKIIALSALVGAIYLIITQAVIPLIKIHMAVARAAVKVEELGPVILTIAEQFKKNGGSSLKDAVDRLESGAARRDEAIAKLVEGATVTATAAESAVAAALAAKELASRDHDLLKKIVETAEQAKSASDEACKVSLKNSRTLEELAGRAPVIINTAQGSFGE